MNSLATNTAELIGKHPFFNGLNPVHLDLLGQNAARAEFPSRQHIFYEQAEADRFYLILSGKVAVEMFVAGKGVVTLDTIGGGDALGWSWFFPPYVWQFSARAIAPTETIAFDAKKLRELAAVNRDFGYELAMRVANVLFKRLQCTRSGLANLYGQPV